MLRRARNRHASRRTGCAPWLDPAGLRAKRLRPGNFSSRYSAIASESQTRSRRSTSTGTRPTGLTERPRGRASRREVEAQLDLLEFDAELAHQHPGSHRPGRIVLVADIELKRHGSYTRCQGAHIVRRRASPRDAKSPSLSWVANLCLPRFAMPAQCPARRLRQRLKRATP